MPKKTKFYIDKQELIDEVSLCQQNDEVSEELANMFYLIIEGISEKFQNLKWYGIEEDVKQDCVLLLLQKYQNFKVDRGTSCFCYISTIVFNHIRYQLTRNKRQKDKMDMIRKTIMDYFNDLEGHL